MQLSDWQGLSNKVVPGPARSEVDGGLRGGRGARLGFVEVEEGREGSKLRAFDVDFKDVNKIMTIVFHELAEAPHLNVYIGIVIVNGAKCPGLEMGSVGVRLEFRTPLLRQRIGLVL